MPSTEFRIEENTEFGEKAVTHLRADAVVWLTTVGPSGTPQPNPVWFLWHAGAFLVFTQPGTPKLRNMAANPRVSLNFNSTDTGGDVIVFTGAARIETDPPSDAELAAFVEKYADGLVDIGMTRDQFFADYSTVVRIEPDRLRGF